MNTVAIVPVKTLRQAKSRLSGALSPDERVSRTLSMLEHVLDAIGSSGVVSKIAVISPEDDLPPLPRGVELLRQAGDGLNNALEEGRKWAIREKAAALMVIFADLPLLLPGDILDMEDLGQGENTIVLAPDRHGQGTNAMLAHPVALARFAFGPGSYEKHRDEAEKAGARIETYVSVGTSLDIDTPDDLLCLERERLAAVQY